MTYPGARQVNRLYTTAKRVVDEDGKGQEVLRQFSTRIVAPADMASPTREVIGIPDVDIIITDIVILAEASDNCDVDVVAPVAFDTAPAAANELIATIDSSAADIANDVVSRQTLLGLNGNRVVAGQPIIIVCTDDAVGAPVGQFYVRVSYILADAEVSYAGS